MADSLLSSHNKTKSKSRSTTSYISKAIQKMKSIRCPRGTRRLNGKCVKIEDYLLQKSMIPRKNCPKGTRRSKVSGECIKNEEYLVEQSQRIRTNCPPGTRRNLAGDCVYFTPVEKPVTLLGNNQLFQVSFDKSRLKKYEPVITVPSVERAQQPGSITLLNSIVALGFLDTDKAKEIAVKAKKHEIDPLKVLPDMFDIDSERMMHKGLTSYDGIEGLAKEVNQTDETQPTKERTAGSTFRNPTGFSSTGEIDDLHDLKAWKLIEDAGMRGATCGGAKISEKHSNFLINTGTASADDLESLGEQVRKSVFQKSKVKLQWEIIRVGETNL